MYYNSIKINIFLVLPESLNQWDNKQGRRFSFQEEKGIFLTKLYFHISRELSMGFHLGQECDVMEPLDRLHSRLDNIWFFRFYAQDGFTNFLSQFRPCFFRWSKQFNHSHPPSTNFNQLQPLLSTTKFHCILFSTHFNLFQPTSPIYHPLFTTERNRPLVWQ